MASITTLPTTNLILESMGVPFWKTFTINAMSLLRYVKSKLQVNYEKHNSNYCFPFEGNLNFEHKKQNF